MGASKQGFGYGLHMGAGANMIVESKSEMYELFQRGAFGNRPRMNTELHGFKGGVCVRTLRRGGPFKQCQGIEEAIDYGKHLNEPFNLSELVSAAVLQGEVWRDTKGLYLRYTTIDKPMRLAFQDEELHAKGMVARSLIQCYMDASSYDDLNDLLDLYDGAVVEFSCHATDVGTCPRRNTIFWEVRHY